jgi:hypothetical protein
MTFDLEVMLRGNERVFSETLGHEREPAAWTDADVDAVLRKILRAVDRIVDPEAAGDRPVALRGLSWIVSPYQDGVVIAFEIHSASAVAGPFRVEQRALETMMGRVIAAAAAATAPPTVH